MACKRGFTLLELIIVIIVIGILASIALPRFSRTVERTRVVEAKNMLSAIRNAQFRYYSQYSNYANHENKLDIEVVDGKYFNFSVWQLPDALGSAGRLDHQRGDYDYYVIV